MTEAQILDSMRHIIDPDLGRDIVSLGFIKNLAIQDGNVSFTLELTTPACPVKDEFKNQCHAAVMRVPGVKSVNVTLSAMQPKQKTGPDINTLEMVDAIIAVSSCKGGVGKSTVAAHLARAMQREGLEVGLLDADVYGPSAPTLFNAQQPSVAMYGNKIMPVEIDGLKVMSLGFLMGDAPAVLRGPMVSGFVTQVLKQTDWGKLDYLIIDMPPGTGDIQLTIVQQAALDGAIIVTTPHSLSLVDVARGILMFEKVHVPVLGLVENMSYFVCDNCEKKHYLFGAQTRVLKDRFGLETLAEFPMITGISNVASRDAGHDVEPVQALAANVHRQIGKNRIQSTALPVVTPQPGRLHIVWPSGGESVIPNRDVRIACRCARCVDEFTGEQVLDPATVPADIQAEGVTVLGNYAVSISWNDGHSTGIFSWELLKSLAERARAN